MANGNINGNGNRKSKAWLWVLLILIAGGVAAYALLKKKTPEAPADPCANVQCREGEICFDGFCFNPAIFNCEVIGCPPGQICRDGECVDLVIPDFCRNNGDCPPGSICAGGFCVPLIIPPECAENLDCALGDECCRAGEVGCVEGQCVPHLCGLRVFPRTVRADQLYDFEMWVQGLQQDVRVEGFGLRAYANDDNFPDNPGIRLLASIAVPIDRVVRNGEIVVQHFDNFKVLNTNIDGVRAVLADPLATRVWFRTQVFNDWDTKHERCSRWDSAEIVR